MRVFAKAQFCLLTILAPFANAKVFGFAVPSTIKPGDTFPVKILTGVFISPIQDIDISFGVVPASDYQTTALGNYLGSRPFLPDESNPSHNVNIPFNVTVPKQLRKGPAVFSACSSSLAGDSYLAEMLCSTVNVTVGSTTDSNNYKSSVHHPDYSCVFKNR